MGRKPTPTKAKASKSAATNNTKASPPTLPDATEPKPVRVPNPLLTDPAIHAQLQPLFDALVMVAVRSQSVADCCSELLAMKEACGMPGADEWPDSPKLKRARSQHDQQAKAIRDRSARKGRGVVVADYTEPRWTKLIREWCGCFRDWCAAIAMAKKLAGSPGVAELMDAGESRPAQRWTARTMIEIDNLARTLHPVRMGEDGMGFIRDGLRPLAPGFHACIEAVRGRIAELRSIPVAAAAPIREGEARSKATRRQRKIEWLTVAMLMVQDHPEWSDAAIAGHVGIHKSRLSRSPMYQRAAKQARQPKTPAGSVRIVNGNRELEAVDDSYDPNRPASRQSQHEEDADARLDREWKRNTKRNAEQSKPP